MNIMVESKNIAKTAVSGGKLKMTPSEAFVETLVAQGVKDTFGIVGSAYMDAHDLFPLAAYASSPSPMNRTPRTWPMAIPA